ncbi:MAG: hypothetical protein MJ211_09105 [Bacteroidales bacterium]|nr:hypothetical protein [Bacteroidales bacterium]
MKQTLFLIGIGGTGMRCLEAFVHTCAIGMLDNSEINILALDTDLDNGNFSRLKTLIEDGYMKVKGYNRTHYPLQETFFSAKINLFTFTPDYSNSVKSGSFEALTKYAYANDSKKDLANILLTPQVREFDLKHGYRAQTHLGSLLMYHSIIEEVTKNPHGKLAEFIQKIYDAGELGDARVFVCGSVFGGTGASSIPILPKAFNAAINILEPGKTLTKAFFGATLLSAYFKFTPPDESLRSRQKVVASSKNFALNSQIAMMFYNEDKTVKSVYQKFYMIGTPSNDFETKTTSTETITGGAQQKNDSHYIELLSAFAALDFFETPISKIEEIKRTKQEVQYYYRTIAENGRVDFKDFASAERTAEFARKFGALVALSYLVYPEFTDFVAAAQSGMLAKNNISGYEDILPQEVAGIKKYFELFHFGILPNGTLTDGWLRQMHRSAGGLDNFLFNAELFGVSNVKELRKFDFNKLLFRSNEDDIAIATFKTGLFGSTFDSFKNEFVKQHNNDSIQYKIEKIVKRMYDTINALYGFKI